MDQNGLDCLIGRSTTVQLNQSIYTSHYEKVDHKATSMLQRFSAMTRQFFLRIKFSKTPFRTREIPNIVLRPTRIFRYFSILIWCLLCIITRNTAGKIGNTSREAWTMVKYEREKNVFSSTFSCASFLFFVAEADLAARRRKKFLSAKSFMTAGKKKIQPALAKASSILLRNRATFDVGGGDNHSGAEWAVKLSCLEMISALTLH